MGRAAIMPHGPLLFRLCQEEVVNDLDVGGKDLAGKALHALAAVI